MILNILIILYMSIGFALCLYLLNDMKKTYFYNEWRKVKLKVTLFCILSGLFWVIVIPISVILINKK